MAAPEPSGAAPPGRPSWSYSRLALASAILLPALVAGLASFAIASAGQRRSGSHPEPRAIKLSPAVGDLSQKADGGHASYRTDRPRARRPGRPRSISIPSAAVQTTIEPVRVHEGALRVPGIGRAGWFEGGPRPGEPGRSVVIGHLDTRRGPGLFASLPSVRRGATVAITDARNAVHRFSVIGAARVPKRHFPADAVYGSSRSPVLVLITCGGPFSGGHYRDNIVVYARAA